MTDPTPDGEGIRLQRVLALAGFGSRRVCDNLIADGRVTVNGGFARLGDRVHPGVEHVEVDGVPVPTLPGLVYYLLNKPADVVTTASDPQGRLTVLDLVPDEPRVFPVGRLDLDTEGLLILTNDGELAQRVTHPSRGLDKVYLAEVEGEPTRGAMAQLRKGIELDDGVTAPAKANLVGVDGGRAAIELVIHEGRNRQVRRMCDAIGHPVVRLVRVRIGPITDRRLKQGHWRPLEPSEVHALYRATEEIRRRPPTGEGDGDRH